MKNRRQTRPNPSLRVSVGRDFEVTKPRFADTFGGQILVLVFAAVIAATTIKTLEGSEAPENPPIQCIIHTEDYNQAAE